MNPEVPTPGTERRPDPNSHQEFLELCALSIGGHLSRDEERRLERHLAACSACSDVLKEYQKISQLGFSAAAPDLMPDPGPVAPLGSTASAKKKLFRQLQSEGVLVPAHATAKLWWVELLERFLDIPAAARRLFRQGELLSLMRHAAAVLLVAIALVSAYRLGERKRSQLSESRPQVQPGTPHALEQQVGNLTQDGQALVEKLHNRDRLIQDLTNRRNRELGEVARLKEQDKNLQDAIANAGEEKNNLAAERDAVTEQMKIAQTSLAKMGDELASLRQQREADLIRASDLESGIVQLSQRLKDREDTIEEQQKLLAADRDIRELMGARDLYLAEVYDVGRNGDTQKPFGRIFFTKNRSLIFYAYDLDQQPRVKNANVFQAWGQRGPDRKQALSLGIFYQDNAANKRWVLKVEDPKTLEQINAVFVTVEPQGGSREPSGHPLLFASLRVEPNHP
jgi:anti-sigma factor RsiW